MKNIRNCIKLNRSKYKRKKFLKKSNSPLTEIKLTELFSIIRNFQSQNSNSQYNHNKSLFIWEKSTKNFVELNPNSKLYEWIFPIKFSSILGFILEILQQNIHYILEEREKTFESICLQLKIDIAYFYKLIGDIQFLLIKFGKVKICKNGTVVIMYDVQ